jgi:PAT family beta-lactamase induction signal transducer AmpG
MATPRPTHRNPWAWVCSIYFAEGLPYVIVMNVAVIMYKRFGISNTDIGLYTGWFYLPWVLKPLWSPVVDILKTRRAWIAVMQLIISTALAGLALTMPLPQMVQYSLAFFWLLAFSSATHDIAVDGFYLLATTEREQAFFVGIRSTVYRLAMILCQGPLVILAGRLEKNTNNLPLAWSVTFGLVAGTFAVLTVYHWIILPRPEKDVAGDTRSVTIFWAKFFQTFAAYFKKEKIG